MKRASSSLQPRRSGSGRVSDIVIRIADDQRLCSADKRRLRQGVRMVLEGENRKTADVSIAVVDDSVIRDINRRYLQHDKSTDVVSFVLSDGDARLEGEIIVSVDTAAKEASRFGWAEADELLLYVIHGALHLVGYDDRTAAARRTMRRQEQFYLRQFGLSPRY